jgi:4-diphosphocytidyl-2-C-methyl-D-erythritol kinase
VTDVTDLTDVTDVLRAHAKLTLSLRVTGVRADGYHLLDAEMVTLDLHDVLIVDPHGDGLDAVGPFSAGVPLDRGNLVAKALGLAGRRAHVTIDKRIPHGGGLGGGSTDAAAILRWAGVTDPMWPPRSAPTCRSASWADGPACVASARSSNRCRSSTAR